MTIGRPTDYSEELAAEICQAIATIPAGLQRICDMHPNFPSNKSVIYVWLAKYPNFQDRYARAKMAQLHVLVDDRVDRALDRSEDFFDEGNGKLRVNHAALARNKRLDDTVQWLAENLMPKVYSKKMHIEAGLDEESRKAMLEHAGALMKQTRAAMSANKLSTEDESDSNTD